MVKAAIFAKTHISCTCDTHLKKAHTFCNFHPRIYVVCGTLCAFLAKCALIKMPECTLECALH